MTFSCLLFMTDRNKLRRTTAAAYLDHSETTCHSEFLSQRSVSYSPQMLLFTMMTWMGNGWYSP